MLKDILVTLKIRDIAMIYQRPKSFRHFARVLFSGNFAFAEFRENKILAKISEFTVFEYVRKVLNNEAHILPDRILTSPKREIIKASAANLVIKIYKEKK